MRDCKKVGFAPQGGQKKTVTVKTNISMVFVAIDEDRHSSTQGFARMLDLLKKTIHSLSFPNNLTFPIRWSLAMRFAYTILNLWRSGWVRFGSKRVNPERRRCVNRSLLVKRRSLFSSIARTSFTSNSAHWRHTLLKNNTQNYCIVKFSSAFLSGVSSIRLTFGHISQLLIKVERQACTYHEVLNYRTRLLSQNFDSVPHILN